MDYKKEYEAMVQRARELHEGGNALTKQQMEIVCPELKESEDEKIRKAIIHHILYETKLDEATEHSWVAYLEKQKINTEGDFARGYDCGYECCLNSHGAEWFEKQKEQDIQES